jgi:hypothetical protein
MDPRRLHAHVAANFSLLRKNWNAPPRLSHAIAWVSILLSRLSCIHHLSFGTFQADYSITFPQLSFCLSAAFSLVLHQDRQSKFGDGCVLIVSQHGPLFLRSSLLSLSSARRLGVKEAVGRARARGHRQRRQSKGRRVAKSTQHRSLTSAPWFCGCTFAPCRS